MARRVSRGRTPRRRSYWLALHLESSGVNVASNTRHDDVLMSLADDHNTTTIIRIVGAVYAGIQVAAAFVAPVYWGIYKRQGSGSVSSLVLNPLNLTDVGDENWMHWRVLYHFLADDQIEQPDAGVDIKVKRKIDGGDSIIFTAISTVNYHVAVNLRGLFLAT